MTKGALYYRHKKDGKWTYTRVDKNDLYLTGEQISNNYEIITGGE